MSYEGVSYDRIYGFGYLASIVSLIALVALVRPAAKPEPANSRAYGCYVADAAPSIRLDRTGMTILQSGFTSFSYHLERTKMAITLAADAPIQLNRSGARYIYSLYHPGIGEYLNFHHVVDGEQYGQFDETQLSSFSILANDGVNVTYNKVMPKECPLVEQTR